MMPDRCMCGCGRPAAIPYAVLLWGGFWRHECLEAITREVLALRAAAPEVVGARVAWLRDNQAPMLARAVVGVVPFDGERDG